MPHVRLNDRKIQSLSTESAQEDFWDSQLPGFGLRVTRTGHKTFVVRYRAFGRRRRYTLGVYPTTSLATARDAAKAALGDIVRGSDPQDDKARARGAETFAALAAEYLEKHAKRKKRSWREDQRKLDKTLLPAWGPRKATEVTRRDVMLLLDHIVERGAPIHANRVRALISKIFNFGIQRGIVEANPAHLVERPGLEKARDRVLSFREITLLWQALDDAHPVVAANLRLRLLTAQRGVEIKMMRWADLDGDWWTIPAAVAKNGLQHRVPLSPQVQAVLEALRPLTGDSEWVLASPRKDGSPFSALQRPFAKIRARCGVEFVPHDLRRTAASHMTSLGISRLVVAKILNHVEHGVTAVYDRHSYDAEKREALLLWGEKLPGVGSKEGGADSPTDEPLQRPAAVVGGQ